MTSTDTCGRQQQEKLGKENKEKKQSSAKKNKAVSCSLKIYPREFCLQKEGLQITCVEAPGILHILQRLKFLYNHCV